MPMLGLSAAAFTTAATAATVTTATTAAATAAASAAFTATLTSIAIKVGINVAISAAMSLLQPNVGAAGRTFEWTLDPDGPIPFAAGRVGVAGSAVYRRTFGPDLMYYGIPSVLSGAGPIDGFEGFMADDEVVTFDATGKAITSQYKGELWYKNSLGRQPDTALVSPSGLKNGASLIGWTAANRLSGKACYLIVMGENSKGTAYPTGEIKPLVTLRGLKGWDPRQDSTYPGGSGPCRLHDPSTWVYITNPIIWALKWSLGLWEGPTGKGAPQVDYQVGGIGAKLSGIDVPAFVSAANVADANGWTVAAYPTTDDDKAQVLDAFLQAGGAIYAQRAGKISCIQRAAPRASIVTISAADTAGPLEIDTAASRIDRINTIRPRFWSEAHRWQMTALPEVTAAAYQAEDGGKRTRGLDLHYVSNAKQAAQLAALQIANTREGIAGVIPLKPHLQRIRPGDAFTITEPGFVLNGLKCLCLNTDYDPATGVVRVSFVSETDAKYPFAMGQNPTPPAPQVLTPVDPGFVSPPEAGDWTIIVRPPSPGGGQLPGFDLGGIVSNETATAIIVEHGPNAEGPWTQAYQGPPTVTKIPIDGLQPGATYYVAIQYQRNQNYSARQVYGPYTAPALIGDVMPNAPGLSQIKADIEAAFGDIFDVSGLVADARADIDAQGVEIAAARGGQPSLNSRILELNQAQIDGDAANAQAISLVQARTENTEADIIDLENALASETLARAEAINQVNARSGLRANLIDNPSGAGGFRGWIKEGSPASYVDDDRLAGRIFVVYGYMVSQVYPAVPGDQHSLGFVSSPLGDGGHLKIQYMTPTGPVDALVVPSGPGGYDVRRRSSAPSTAPAGTTGFRVVVVPPTGGVLPVWAIKVNFGAVAADFSDDYSATVLEASVTQQSLAIIDLESGAALAKFELIATATGGKPARFRLISSALGSAIALDAPFIYWGENTVFDDATDTLQTTIDGRIRVMALGAPFGVGGTLLEWWGPTGIALSAMTTANGDNGRMTSAPYVFDNVVGVSTVVAASISYQGDIGYPQGLSTLDTPVMNVLATGKISVELTGFALSLANGSSITANGSIEVFIVKGGTETKIGSTVNLSAGSTADVAINLSALNVATGTTASLREEIERMQDTLNEFRQRVAEAEAEVRAAVAREADQARLVADLRAQLEISHADVVRLRTERDAALASVTQKEGEVRQLKAVIDAHARATT
ncbi:hypothetical protein [Brevundimonas sp. P7753]|uniref:hypothetical protein n=1 Tax=Brevundimonas sp. P7753 TaxID=2726982 RepID=UPI0015C1195F|nr:hypothetical protein [Brevundimonas sp. P7753]NWE54262.1 hypothetical protein [Brevundimonas sp. P7753]